MLGLLMLKDQEFLNKENNLRINELTTALTYPHKG